MLEKTEFNGFMKVDRHGDSNSSLASRQPHNAVLVKEKIFGVEMNLTKISLKHFIHLLSSVKPVRKFAPSPTDGRGAPRPNSSEGGSLPDGRQVDASGRRNLFSNGVKLLRVSLIVIGLAIWGYALCHVPSVYGSDYIINSGATVNISSGSVNVDGNIVISGELNVNTGSISLTGDWTNNNSFTCGTSTVTFTNATSTSTLTGSTTFYGLVSTASGKLLKLTSGTTFYVTNMVDFEYVTLRSTAGGEEWFFTYTGSSQTLKSVDVKDSNASGGTTMAADGFSINSGNNTNWTFGETITTTGSGNWHSTTLDAPWPGGNVPGPVDVVIIDTGHVVTSTAPVTISSITVTGSLYLDGEGQAITFTIGNGGELINNGTVRVSSATYNVTLQAETGGGITFEGNDIDYNGRKIYLARIDYKPVMSLGSGETVELSGSCTFYALTTLSGGSVIQGTNNDVYISSNTTLASGTFTKDAGSGKVYFVGDLTLDSNNQNLGQVVIGSSPETTTLSSDFTADSLTISSGDVFNTKGYEVTVTTDIVINGTLDCTDSPPDNEGDATIITLGRDWTKAAISTFTNASSTSTLTGSTTFYGLVSTASGKNVKVSSDTVIGVTGHLNFGNIILRSTLNGATWYLNLSGSATQDVHDVDVQDSNASGGNTIVALNSTDSGNNTNWDFGPPAAITDLAGQCDSDTGDVILFWSTPGDDDWTGILPSGSKYRIDYSTYSKQWDKEDYEVQIPTYGVTPGTTVSYTITGLTGDTTWYFQIWTRDEVPTNWSGLSNGATIWIDPILSVSISTDTYNFDELNASTSAVSTANITVTNDGNVTETYSIKCSSTTKWTPNNAPGNDEFSLQSAFHPSEPNNDDISWESDDILTESLQQCTTAAFSIDNSQSGKNVSPFESNIRNFWLRIKTPLSTSTTTQQGIKVTISAEQGSP